MERRTFLGVLASAAAGMVLDPERLLWVPGQKTIFLPPDKTLVAAQEEDLLALMTGLGGPFLIAGTRRDPVWGVVPSPESAIAQLSDDEYRLVVDRGRRVLAARRQIVRPDGP